MRLHELVAYLDAYLAVRETGDDSLALNGLQVENSGEVTRLAVAVDACQAVIDEAARRAANLLVVHHGLFWAGLEPLRDRAFRRVAALVRHDIAVYAAHIPLDRHPDVGNNAVLARQLGIVVRGWWGEYQGAPIGVWGELGLPREDLARRLESVLGVVPRVIAGGPVQVQRVGVITGSGGAMIKEARAAGLDSYVTGEGPHWTYFDAEELGVNVYYAGHYATETVGVKALAEHLQAQLGIPWSFIDHPTGM